MTNIIREYILPLKNENYKNIYLGNLLDFTWNIRECLENNVCFNNNSGIFDNNLKNSKIKRILSSITNKYYWSMRKTDF